MKLGILGAGMIVQEALPIIKKAEINIGGICATPRSKEKLENLSKEYSIENYYIDYDMMLENDSIDTVYIALPNTMHYESAKKALEMGKNVICEKPFTVKFDELEELNEIAKKNGLILIEAITTQYLENYKEMKNMVISGQLGEIKVVSANFSQFSSRYDNFKKGIISPSFDPKFAGGSLMDLNIYNIHFIVGLFKRPKKVVYEPVIENGIDVSGVLTLVYDDFVCTSIASKSCNSFCTMQIQGTKKTIIMDKPSNECESFGVYEKGKGLEEYNFNKYEHRMQAEFIEIKKVIEDKDYNKVNEMMEISLSVMYVVDQARSI